MIRYRVQAALLNILMLIFAALPLDGASSFGGWIGRAIGPKLGISKRARRHLDMALPGLSEGEKNRIIHGMWDNLGRTLAEYLHLKTIGEQRCLMINDHVLRDTIAGQRGGMFVSNHGANWEAHVPALLARHGVAACLTYRALNNPYADRILKKYRTMDGRVKAWPKARESGRHMIAELKNKGFVAMLVDQKYNEGVAVPFFGRPAMTNPVFVQLCQKYNCPLVLSHCKRLKGAHFEITLHEPLKLFDDAGVALPVENVIAEAHKIIEGWITDAPDQWLWIHRRWDSKKLETL